MLMRPLFICIVFYFFGFMHASADLPIRSDAGLNWKKDLKILTQKANKDIYYWDILTLLTPQPMVSPRNDENRPPDKERLYELRNSGPDEDELTLILKSLYVAAMGLPLDDINHYMSNVIEQTKNPSHKRHIKRLQRIIRYMDRVASMISSDGFVEDIDWQDKEDSIFMRKVVKKTQAIEQKSRTPGPRNFKDDGIFKQLNNHHLYGDYKKIPEDEIEKTLLSKWKKENDFGSDAEYEKEKFPVRKKRARKKIHDKSVIEKERHDTTHNQEDGVSVFDTNCSYENLVRSPTWREVNAGRNDHYLDYLPNDPHTGKKWGDFNANADGVYTYRRSNDVKLITVFGTPRRFQVPLGSPINPPHINDYGFLSNYWSAHSYDGDNYEIPKIQGAQGKIYLRYIEKDEHGKILNDSTYAFNHVEGAYHLGKLILLGKNPKRKELHSDFDINEIDAHTFEKGSPFATQQLAKGNVPFGIQKEHWDRLMFELLKQKFTSDLALKAQLLKIKDAILVEGNDRRDMRTHIWEDRNDHTDTRWGVQYDALAKQCHDSLLKGENKLGRMLMFIVHNLKNTPDDLVNRETVIEKHDVSNGDWSYRIYSAQATN